MLIKRLMPFYIGKGSQSAGNTPVALRKQLLSADRENHTEKNCQDRSNLCGLKNYISNVNTTSLSKGSENKCSDFMKAKRALSLNHSPPKDKLLKSGKQPKLIENVSSEAAIMEADIEATRKYKELISEAEHILVSIKENMLTDNNQFLDLEPQLQPDEFSQENRRTDTQFKTYNATQSARGSMKSKACVTSLSRKLTMKKLRSCDNISENQNVKLFSKRCSRKRRDVRSSTRRQCQQLSNEFSNNETQQTFSGTGSQISLDNNKHNELKNSRSLLPNSSTICANSPRQCSKLLQFQSIDLGNCLSDSGYCPQSEPVKRKVYSGSSMLKKLQMSLRKDNTTTQGPNHLDKEKDASQTDAVPWGETLSSKLELIQHERLVVEAAVLEAQEEERQRASDSAQYHEQVAHLRRQVFLHTIEGLKRSLEDQSAKLEQAYTADSSEGQPCTACDVD
ncbi:uncharacterized protein LOC134529547 [Bacillus rossius redtenbacheri]|uniref:uncharacterized protein LOC134529547 n=1 Tax=Bacillus rossius redtenbacheri TaxID=93214 RepID=UPI002FDE1471